MHNVSQRPNLRHLGKPLGGAEGPLEAVSFKKATESVGIEEESRMPDGSDPFFRDMSQSEVRCL